MMLPRGSKVPMGTATESDVAAGKTFMSGGSYKLRTGTMQPTAFAPSKETAQVNATAFNQNGDSYLLLFNAAVPNVNDNLLGLSIIFMTSGDASWEYETGKNLDITAMTYKVMVANGELVSNQQTIDLGSASMTIDINNADISSDVVSFDIVFTPSAGAFTINNYQPMMSVDIWSY